MGLRRFTDKERKAVRAMTGSRVHGGEHPDDVRAAVVRYLTAQGWLPGPARLRAAESVRAATAGLAQPRGERK